MTGFPIRKSLDQSSFDSSPGLIAAYRVLHRLITPRHPPCTLNSLITFAIGPRGPTQTPQARLALLGEPCSFSLRNLLPYEIVKKPAAPAATISTPFCLAPPASSSTMYIGEGLAFVSFSLAAIKHFTHAFENFLFAFLIRRPGRLFAAFCASADERSNMHPQPTYCKTFFPIFADIFHNPLRALAQHATSQGVSNIERPRERNNTSIVPAQAQRTAQH